MEVVMSETWVDKTAWGEGAWQHEPDRVEGREGPLVVLALRNPLGAWCGYIGVTPGHPWHGNDYSSACSVPDCDDPYLCDHPRSPVASIVVHGGVTFADRCMENGRPQRERVCHVPRYGETDDIWWVGFDCAHAFDVVPALPPMGGASHGTYRTLAYVQNELAGLASQAVAAR